MYIIAGLGNPSREYAHTRHNVGFDTIDILADKNNISVDTVKFRALIGKGIIGGEKVILVKPQTYMNLSGESLREAVDYFKIDPSQGLIVIYDDIYLEPGNIRIRKSGSAGGHNGMKSIINRLGTQDFARVLFFFFIDSSFSLFSFIVSFGPSNPNTVSLVTVHFTIFGGIAQLARAHGSYPWCRGFKSPFRYSKRA